MMIPTRPKNSLATDPIRSRRTISTYRGVGGRWPVAGGPHSTDRWIRRWFPRRGWAAALIVSTLAALLVAWPTRWSVAVEPPPESRDRGLLDDIAPLPRPPARSPDSPAGPAGEPSAAGSDLGPPGGQRATIQDPLREMSRKMRSAERQLRAGDASSDTQQLQQQVIEQLDQLIAALESQMQQAASADEEDSEQEGSESSAEGDDSSGMGETPGEGAAGTEAEPGEEGAGQNDRARQPAARSPDDVWGHLPERIRQQLQNAAVERFLPKYEDLIEAYYRRLAEDDSPLTPRSTR